MDGWLPEAEGWVKVLGAFVAVVMAVLVPIRSWIVEDRRYRDRLLAADTTGPAAAPCAGAGALSLAREVGNLAEAVRDCADLLRDGIGVDR